MPVYHKVWKAVDNLLTSYNNTFLQPLCMQFLQELVDLVTRNKVKNLSTLDLHTSPRSQINKLYKAIADGKVDSDEEGAIALFDDATDARYNKVKHDLRQRLLNTVFFVDANHKNTPDADQAFYEVYRDYAIGNILWKRGLRDNAIKILEKVLPKACEYELTEIAVGASRQLKYFYSVITKNKRLYEHYRQLSQQWETIQYKEFQIGDYREELTAYYVDTVGAKAQKDANKRAQEIIAEIDPAEGVDTLFYQFSRFFILVILHMSNHEYRPTIDICNDALQYLSNKKHAPGRFRRIFLLQIMASSITLKDYKEGERAIATYADHGKQGSLPWFNMRELQLMLYLHSQRYAEASDIFFTTVNSKKIASVEASARERWNIYEAHVYWLMEIGKIEPTLKATRKFRIRRFLNEMVTYTKDKEGMNIPILIIQILWLVVKEDYEEARNRISHLQCYNNRYLRKDEMYRTQLFLRMISQLDRGNFHRVAVQRKAAPYLDKLAVHPLAVAQQSWRIEVIPYDHLWEYTVELLDMNLH